MESYEKDRIIITFQLKGPRKTSISRQVKSSKILWYFECRCNTLQRNFHHFQFSQSMNSFYFSLELQNGILICTRILFVVSSVFNAIAFFCLLKETPEHQSKFRNYLLCIQVFCVLYSEKCEAKVFAAINDINFDVAVEPFPMLPAIGGFCKGIVCQWSVPIQYSFVCSLQSHLYDSPLPQATTVLLIGLIGFAISICIIYRHQSIVRGKFKFSKVSWITWWSQVLTSRDHWPRFELSSFYSVWVQASYHFAFTLTKAERKNYSIMFFLAYFSTKHLNISSINMAI